MARPKNIFPIPSLRFKGNAWRIRWREGDIRYEFPTGLCKEQNIDAEKYRLQAALALRGAADWPE